MRRITKSMCAVALVAAAALPLPAKAAPLLPTPSGGGALTLTLTTTSAGLNLFDYSCITWNVNGTGAVAVAGADAGSAYTGPVTVTGSVQACGTAQVELDWISLSMTGNPLVGDFGCQTTMQTGPGIFQRFGVVVLSIVPVACEIGGVPQTPAMFLFPAAAAPTSVDPASDQLDAYTIAGPMQFSV
jgi:hypothetical protein